MDNLFTEEEASRPVTYEELAVILEQMVQTLINGNTEAYKAWLKPINTTTDNLIDAIKDINYKRVRDLKYFINLLSVVCHLDKNAVFDNYNKWCEEFDKLNKPEQEE